jgi:hypothetical protein
MFSFRDGRKEPGIVINKYNMSNSLLEFYFINQTDMNAYKTAFETYNREKCDSLSHKIKIEDIISIRPVSLSDYKMMMQLLDDRAQQLNASR